MNRSESGAVLARHDVNKESMSESIRQNRDCEKRKNKKIRRVFKIFIQVQSLTSTRTSHYQKQL